MRVAERKYYQNMLENNKFNLKKTWQILKDIIGKSKPGNMSDKFLINGSIVEDSQVIANAFNDFYINIGSNLAGKIKPNNPYINPISYIKNDVTDSIFIAPATNAEILKIFNTLKKNSAGWDGLTQSLLKPIFLNVTEPLTHVMNLSLAQGIVPLEHKIAKVTPLFKNDNKMYVNNYRPVSVLPLLSKILERLMYNRILTFINKHDILYRYQFGFRQNYSTNLALITLVDKITESLQKGECVLGVFLDFSKAFDTVIHKILLDKLYLYGIRGTALDWITNYLSDRKQYVVYNNTKSDEKHITCGVPQGSILGPLLFLLYVNDICNVSDILFPILFADDTNIFLNGKNTDELVQCMNCELNKVVIWLAANKLSLNIKKTHFMIFRSKRCCIDNQQDIRICDQKIEFVEHTKFLGIYIDSKLSWSQHISYLKTKLSKGIGVLRKARKLLSRDMLVTLYNSLVFPYLNYCLEVWGGAQDIHIKSLIILHKRTIRLITCSSRMTHTKPIFLQLNLLTLKELYLYKVGLLLFKIVHKMNVPKHINDYFNVNADVHTYNTRHASLFRLPLTRTNLMKRTFRYIGVKLWNRISGSINHKVPIGSFKINLKKYIMYNYCMDIFEH